MSKPSLATASRTHRHRVDLLSERGPTRDATTHKFQQRVPQSARNQVHIAEAELKRRWPTGVLRPRVHVYRNDGGLLQDTSSTMVYSLQQLFEFAGRALTLGGGGARRIFTMEGEELTQLEGIKAPVMEVVISGGEDFKPRMQQKQLPIRHRPSPRKWKPYTVGAMQHPTPSDKKLLKMLPGVDSPKEWGNPRDIDTPLDQCKRRPRIFMFRNDGGQGHECVATLVYTFPSLLEDATQTLHLPRAARRVFTLDGIEISSVDEIVYDMKLVSSNISASCQFSSVSTLNCVSVLEFPEEFGSTW